jgi:hypothetical protein
MNLYVDGEIKGHLVTQDNKAVSSGEDELQDQTMNVYISEETVEEILDGKITFMEALEQGKIKYKAFFSGLFG